MSLTVCTGWSVSGWYKYGRTFLETFGKFWPADVQLHVCGEVEALEVTAAHAQKLVAARALPQIVRATMLDAIPGCTDFMRRFDFPIYHGLLRSSPDHNWKQRAIDAGYNWRYDLVKFCRQGFIPWFVAQRSSTDFLVWLDGDVVTHAPIPSSDVITSLLPPGKAIAYLGREPKHPDIAFQLYDLRSELARSFLEEFSRTYSTGEVVRFKEWHSAYVWHVLAKTPPRATWLHNITPGGRGHVWHQSPLRQWTDHLKGERKDRGRSPERR